MFMFTNKNIVLLYLGHEANITLVHQKVIPQMLLMALLVNKDVHGQEQVGNILILKL